MRILAAIILFFFMITSANANATNFALTSTAFKNNQRVPVLFTCDGGNISPELKWVNPPAKTASFALTLFSPDSVVGMYYNWIIYNIPATTNSLEQGASKNLPDGISTSVNTAGDNIYRGPCPPDSGLHHYDFVLYALDAPIDLSSASDIDDVMVIIEKHKIASATLVGLFSH